MKALKYVEYVLFLIGVLSLVYFLALAPTTDAGVGVMLIWAYIIVAIAVVVTILFPVLNLFTNPKGAVRSLLGLALLVVLIGVSYALSSDAPIITPADTFDNPLTLKITDTQLYTAYVMLAVAVLAVIGGEIRNALK